jgi:hypothetical protein
MQYSGHSNGYLPFGHLLFTYLALVQYLWDMELCKENHIRGKGPCKGGTYYVREYLSSYASKISSNKGPY